MTQIRRLSPLQCNILIVRHSAGPPELAPATWHQLHHPMFGTFVSSR